MPTAVSPPNVASPRVEPVQPPASRSSRSLGLTIDGRDLMVQQVQVGSAAAMSGFRAGDRLMALNGQRLVSLTALQSFLALQPETATFTIARGQQITRVQVRF